MQRVHAGNRERAFIDLRSKVHRAFPLPRAAVTSSRSFTRVSRNNTRGLLPRKQKTSRFNAGRVRREDAAGVAGRRRGESIGVNVV